ncbi:MAG: hypothetical protein ACQESR_23720, partial [Planctomycetota bacterium]
MRHLSELDQLAKEQQNLESRRTPDLARAKRHREESLKKVRSQRAQTEKQLEAEQLRHQLLAPFSGRVVYRAPA